MKKISWVIGILVIVLIVTAIVVFGMPGLYQGRVFNAASTRTASLCGSDFAKVFDGTIQLGAQKHPTNNWYPLTVSKSTSLDQLRNMVKNGCSLKVARTDAGGGASNSGTYECTFASTDPDNMFYCSSSKYSLTGWGKDESYNMLMLVFDGGKVYYAPSAGEQSPPYMELSLFAKK